nr:ribonuclease H-like domain-containing protein [Tanacetum cinerariifolium]
MVSSVKLPILKKGEYILWTMKIEQYMAHTDCALWEVILNGNSVVQMTKDEAESLDKGYDRFQRLLSLLEIHGAGVSTQDENQKFLRSLPSAWSNISLIMRNKPGIDNLDIDDLYNKLKVYEADIKGSSGSSSNSQNVAFVSVESTSSTNELNAAYSVSTAIVQSSQAQEDLEKIDQVDLEEMDLKCQEFREHDKNAGYRGKHNGKRPTKEDNEQAFVVQHGLGTYDWSYQVEEEVTYFALMAFTSNPSRSSSSKSEVQSYSKQCEQSYKKLKSLFVEQREKLSKANIEIIGYQYDLESIEGELRVHQQNKVIYEEKIGVLEYQVKDKKEEVTETVFDNRSSDEENSVANDRFKKCEGYYAVPLPLTGNYMPPKLDLSFAGLDDSIYKFKISEIVTSLAKDEKDTPKTSTAYVEKPKEDRMAKKSMLPTNVSKGTGHRESRPVWNNVQRINHQNKFAPTTVFTMSGRIPVSATKPKAASSTSAAKLVNTAGPKQSVNFSRTRGNFHKSHSPIRRSFYNATAHSRRNSTKRVNTARSKAVSVVKRNEVTVVKTSAGCVWRPRVNEIDQLSKDNRWICTCVDYVDPQGRLKSGKKAYLADYQEIHDGDFVAFGSSRASIDESNLWHRRLGHVNFKIMNKLVTGNLVRERNTRTLIEAARTMLADSLLPVTFWAEVVNTACYVLNRALVTKTHNKAPYELLNGRSPRLDFMRPFGCPVTILNTLDPLGKFEVSVGNQIDKNTGPQDTNGNAGTQDNVDTGKEVFDQHYIVLPLWSSISYTYKSLDDKPADDKPKDDTGSKTVEELVNKKDQAYRDELDRLMSQEKEASDDADALRNNPINAASTSGTFSAGGPSSPHPDAFISANTLLIFSITYDDDLDIYTSPVQSVGVEADFNNMKSSTIVSPIPTHKMEPKKVSQALDDESCVEAMQEELLQLILKKKDERGIVVRNKAKLVAQGHRQEEGIKYDEFFAPVARIEAIKIFLAFASFMRFIVYQME